MAGVSGAPNMPAYSASKAAVDRADEVGREGSRAEGHPRERRLAGVHRPGRMWEMQAVQQAAAGSQYYASIPRRSPSR